MSLDERNDRTRPFGPEERSFYEPAALYAPAEPADPVPPARLVALAALEREFHDLLVRST